jgi:SH3-like domain-containing protein
MMTVKPSSYKVIVREAYIAQYGDPIAFRHGDPIEVQRADAAFTEWLWCRGPDEKEGWVHRSFLSQSSGRAVAIADYSAKELTVVAGDQARMIRVLDGWAFVELDGSAVGWVPERVLKTSTSNQAMQRTAPRSDA